MSMGRSDATTGSGVKPLRILVAEDHEKVRHQVCALLETKGGFQVVAEVSNGREAVDKAQELQPEVVVMDLSMPVMGGLEAAAHLRRTAPRSKILFLSQHCSKAIAEIALATGASGHVVASDAAIDLIPAVETVSECGRFVSSCLSQP